MKRNIKIFIIILLTIIFNFNTTKVYASDIDIYDMKISDKKVQTNKTVEISFRLKLSDDIRSIVVGYKEPITGAKINYIDMKYNKDKDLYEGHIDIYNYSESGNWRIYDISVRDEYDNLEVVYNSNITNPSGYKSIDLSKLDFLVDVENSDTKHPIIDYNSIKVDKEKVNIGDEVLISLDASDDISGIKFVELMYSESLLGEKNTTYMTFNEDSKCYESKIYVDDTLSVGNMKIDTIHISDNNNNGFIFYNEDFYEENKSYQIETFNLSKGDFEIVNYPINNNTVETNTDKEDDIDKELIYKDEAKVKPMVSFDMVTMMIHIVIILVIISLIYYIYKKY